MLLPNLLLSICSELARITTSYFSFDSIAESKVIGDLVNAVCSQLQVQGAAGQTMKVLVFGDAPFEEFTGRGELYGIEIPGLVVG